MLKTIIILLALSSYLLSACTYNKLKDKQASAIKKPIVTKTDKKAIHAVNKSKYIPFRNKVAFKCAGMEIILQDFTLDMDDVPVTAKKATMFYAANIDILNMPPSQSGKSTAKFYGQVWPTITFGRGKLRRSLPQSPKYIERKGYALGNTFVGYKGGVQYFDKVINAKDKNIDVYYDIKCKSNVGKLKHFKYKTVIQTYKWPKRKR